MVKLLKYVPRDSNAVLWTGSDTNDKAFKKRCRFLKRLRL